MTYRSHSTIFFGIHIGFVPTRHFCKIILENPYVPKSYEEKKKSFFNISFLIGQGQYTKFSLICVKYMPSGFINGVTLK